jgi:hypothetical protein
MSSGWGTIACVEIANGKISFRRVWGHYAPTPHHSIELRIWWRCHGASEGNIHDEPRQSQLALYLTEDEFLDLASQLSEELAERPLAQADGGSR